MLNKSGGSKLETQTHVPLQSSIHPTPLPFFCGCFSQSKNIFSFQKIKCLMGFETVVMALNILFILSFRTGTFPVSSQDKGRRLWNTFKHVCEMHSTAELQGVWQSAGSCLQAVYVSTWGSFPCSVCHSVVQTCHRGSGAGTEHWGCWQVETVLCLLPSAVVMFGWIFYLFMLNTTITSCV